jgi:hypothetical protein
MLKFADIARALKVPYETVCHICTYKPVPAKKKRYGGPEWKLEQKHIDFLTSETTLQEWAAYTMHERAVLFHRKYANKKVSRTSLQRLYKQHKIKFKNVRQKKGMP